ncbi:hypothetical protein, partial [Enterobacter roggenkampii]
IGVAKTGVTIDSFSETTPSGAYNEAFMLNRGFCCPEKAEQKYDKQCHTGNQHDIAGCWVISQTEGCAGTGGVYAKKPGKTQTGRESVK